MDIERLKELKQQIKGVHDGINGDDLNLLYDLLPLVDEAVARQSVKSEEVAISKTETTGVVSDGFSYDAKPKQYQCLGCLDYFYMPSLGNYCPKCGRRLTCTE